MDILTTAPLRILGGSNHNHSDINTMGLTMCLAVIALSALTALFAEGEAPASDEYAWLSSFAGEYVYLLCLVARLLDVLYIALLLSIICWCTLHPLDIEGGKSCWGL